WEILGGLIGAIDWLVGHMAAHYRAALGEPHGWLYAAIVGLGIAVAWGAGLRLAWRTFRAGLKKPEEPRAAKEGLAVGFTAFTALSTVCVLAAAGAWFTVRFFTPGEAVEPRAVADGLTALQHDLGQALGWAAPKVDRGLDKVADRSRPVVANVREIMEIFGPLLLAMAVAAVSMVLLARRSREWWKVQAPITKVGVLSLTVFVLPFMALFAAVVLKRAL
ncbi:MAG: hypothetical protein H6702_19620, partial [Myxococcales bacterium]|nr:hypothetical protein [Myxococcales bacterium]